MIWQRNGLDAESPIAHTEAVKCGEAALLVAPSPTGARITVENPSQVIVATSPADRRVRLAALKRWVEDDGRLRANVYLPDATYRYVGPPEGTVTFGPSA